MARKKNSSVLIIPDMHIPYEHKDALSFLKAVKKKYQPDKVISVGDFFDFHALSFHDSDVDLFSAGDELKEAHRHARGFYKLFPDVDIVASNHGCMVARRYKSNGIPLKLMKTDNEIYNAPSGWVFHDNLKLKLSNGENVYIVHQGVKRSLNFAKQMGMNVIQGHYHSQFDIEYSSTPEKLVFGMTTGCLIDTKSMAFAYNKTQVARPILGCAIILNGIPHLIPMILDDNGRWIKKL